MGEPVLLNKKDLENMLRDLASKQRNDVRIQVVKAEEARRILGMSVDTFYKHLKDPECLVQPSMKKGMYSLKSIYDEAKRLNYDYELL